MSAYLHLQQWPTDPDKSGLIQSVNQKIRLVWQKNPLYSLSLRGRGTTNLAVIPTDSWPGSLTEGRQIIDGKFILGSETALLQHLWYPKHLSQSALAELHSFEWLRNLRAHGENSARRTARQLILNWIDRNQNWQTLAWRPDIVGNRLSNWVGLYDFFCASADDSFRTQFFKSLYRQARHLSRSWMDVPTSAQKLYALHGLIHVIICLNHETHRLPGLMRHLDKLVKQQIFADGGHCSRSPILQLMIMRLLIDLKALCRQANVTLPESIHEAIQRMAPLVRLFRHTDGGIACFGPYQKINPNLVDMALTLSDVRGRPPQNANEMGYERATAKSGLVLFNKVPTLLRAPCNNIEEGTGIFNFEWSSSKRRIITYADVVLQSDRGLYAQALKSSHGHLQVKNKTHIEGALIEGEYQSHHPTWSFAQARSLYLNNKDYDFRGEDIISTHVSGMFALRFVFHPDMKVTHHGKKIYIETPDDQRWIFMSNCTDMHIEVLDTSYPAQMLLVMGQLTPNKTKRIRWAFRGE
jgi:uncharacterized heparinase superfamily protein